MGATNCPETPRQRMISMMYLVLTALLALNVSVEILNAFVTVNESMEKTNANFASKNIGTYSMFFKAYKANEAKVGPFYNKALKAQGYAKSMVDYVNNMKYQLLIETGDAKTIEEAKNLNAKDIKRKDNFDVPTQFFIGQNEASGKGAKGEDLKNKIIEYKKNMLELLSPEDRKKINMGLNVEDNIVFKDKDGKTQNWQQHNFYHSIIVATLTILNKTVAEILNSEYDVVNQLYSAVDQGNIAFDKIEAKVIPNSNYVLLGDQYQAQIFVGAFDTKSVLTATIGGSTIKGDSGLISYKVPASSEGLKKYEGNITVNTPTGKRDYAFKSEYIVAKPSATVSADKMNVFYIGVPNPISISAPGIANEKLKPVFSGAGIKATSKGGGKYEVYVTGPVNQMATINVNAEMDGKQKSMGKSEFRVKKIPNPVPAFNSDKEPLNSLIDFSYLKAASAVVAKLPPDFDFEFKFDVTSFTMQLIVGTEAYPMLTARSGKFTPEMISQITSKAKKGTKIYIENIIVKAPEGSRKIADFSKKIR